MQFLTKSTYTSYVVHTILYANFCMSLVDYSPWSKGENWPFLKVAVSPKPEKVHPPKLVYMHVTSIHTCMIFLSQFRLIKLFDDHGQKGKIGHF